MRIYDSRLGKFLSMDPLFREYPWNATYSFAENDVIRCIDLDREEKYIVNQVSLEDGRTQLSIILDQSLTLSQHINGGVMFSFDGGTNYNFTNLNDPALDQLFGNSYFKGNKLIFPNDPSYDSKNSVHSEKTGANEVESYLGVFSTNLPGGFTNSLTCNTPVAPFTPPVELNNGARPWTSQSKDFTTPASSLPFVPVLITFNPNSKPNSLSVTDMNGNLIPLTNVNTSNVASAG